MLASVMASCGYEFRQGCSFDDDVARDVLRQTVVAGGAACFEPSGRGGRGVAGGILVIRMAGVAVGASLYLERLVAR
mgnify:CR=1 FL=1